MNRSWIPAPLLLVALSFGSLWNFSPESGAVASDFEPEMREHAPVIAPRVPADLQLFGEQVPLADFGIAESLDQELVVNTYRHSSTILYIKRASRWFPVIEPILEAEGVPDDFKYLAVIESGLSQAVSPAGASGFWQFMKGTAPEFGLEISSTVDERYHVEKATRAACQYLKDAHERFGSWVLAAASYNMGMAGVAGALEDQGVSSYWDLYLNEETSRYIFRLLALREVMGKPDQYGFFLSDQDMYGPWETREVVVGQTIDDLAAFSLKQSTTLKTLKSLNPWLRTDRLDASQGKAYTLKIPA